MGRRKLSGQASPAKRTPIEPITTDEEIDALSIMSGLNWRDYNMSQFGVDCKRKFIRDELEITDSFREMSAYAWADVANKFYGNNDGPYCRLRSVMEREFIAAALLEGVPLDYELKLFKLRFRGGRKLLSAVRKGLVRAPVLEPELAERLNLDDDL